MEQIKELIYAMCICAILSAGTRLLSPEKMRKDIRVISTLMMILCAAARFSGGFTVDIGRLPELAEERGSFREKMIAETEPALRSRLDKKLAELGIAGAETGIVCTLDEYNHIRAEKVHIRLTDGSEKDKALALDAAAELFPGAETEVISDGDTEEMALR